MHSNPQSIDLSEWISSKEAAQYLSVTPHQTRHLARSGTIEAIKIGHMWLLRRADVERYAISNRKPGPRPPA